VKNKGQQTISQSGTHAVWE